MAYLSGKFTSKFALSFIRVGCNEGTFWFPEGNDNYKTIVVNNYFSLSGGFVVERVDGSNPVIGGPTIHDKLYFYAWNKLIGIVTRYKTNPNAFPGITNGMFESDYVTGSYYGPNPNGDPTSSYYRITVSTDVKKVRNDISNAYFSLFGRYAETSGHLFHLNGWNSTGSARQTYSSIYAYVSSSGNGSGETNAVNVYGRHTGMSTGNCAVLGCTDPKATNYNPNATQNDGTCVYPAPTADINANPSAIIRGNYTDITWSFTNATSATISGIGSVGIGSNGPVRLYPTSTTTYTLTVSGLGGTRTDSVTVYVYVPPVITLTVDNSTIVRGESTTLRWNTTGDANTGNITPEPGPINLNSYWTIRPTVTTTYTAYVSGLGGSDTDQLTVTVIQPPSVSLTSPPYINYGNQVTLSYQATNVGRELILQYVYSYLDGTQSSAYSVNLGSGDNINSSYTFTPSYNNKGPSQITFTLIAYGYGNLQTQSGAITLVNIDQTPDLIEIPESRNKLKNEEPVISPIDGASIQLQVNDIDIPVEIKSEVPVQVNIDNQGYQDVRSL